ncbi:MAG: preprotein translocase subunit SecG [Clostridia bacterium]|nr:preprotein translocase subunit SecG [Clostridia bacterium]
MTVVMYVLGGVLLLAALFLIVAVLMQNSKSHKLSGTIAGGAETFFGKSKGADVNKKLNTATIVVAVIFVVLVIVMYVIQPNDDFLSLTDGNYYVDESGNIIIGGDDALVSDSVVDDSVVDDSVADDSVEDTSADAVEDTSADSVEDTTAEAADEAVSE